QLAANLDTVRHSITAVWLHRLADSELPSPSQGSTPASTVPPVCGQCDARDGDGVATRIIIMTDAHGTERGQKCPRCHPHAATEQQESSTALTSSETNVGEMLGQMMAGKSLGAAPNDCQSPPFRALCGCCGLCCGRGGVMARGWCFGSGERRSA